MTPILIEPHFFACMSAGVTALELLSLLPDNDLVGQCKDLLEVQNELFMHMVQGRHYGSDAIEEFLDFTQEMVEEVERIREAS